MRKRRRVLLTVIALVMTFCMALSGCGGQGGGGSASPAGDGSPEEKASVASGEKVHPVLNLRNNADVQELDPHMTSSQWDYFVYSQIYDTLVRFKGGTDPTQAEPALATEWKMSEDGMSITMTMREGVKFHDGNPLTVEDILYSIERWQASPFLAKKMAAVDHPEAIDDTHFTIFLKAPYPKFEMILCGFPFRIVEKAVVEKKGMLEPMEEYIGTGAYKFVSNEIGVGVKLEANKDWWHGEPYFEEVNYKVIADETTAITALVNHEIDANWLATKMDTNVVLGDDTLKLIELPRSGAHLVWLNNTVAPLDNAKVRQAISCAIDRDKYIDLVWDGIAIGGCGTHIKDFEEGYSDTFYSYYEYDPDRAKALIAESGLPASALKFDLLVQNVGAWPAFGAVFKESMAAIGIDVTIVEKEPGAYETDRNAGNFTAMYDNTAGIPYSSKYYHNLYCRDGAPLNLWKAPQPKLVEILDKADVEMDSAKRIAYCLEAETYIHENALYVPVAYIQSNIGVAKGLNPSWEMGAIIGNVGYWTWEE